MDCAHRIEIFNLAVGCRAISVIGNQAQYTDNQTFSERDILAAYDVNSHQVVFSEELLNGRLYDLGYLYDRQSQLLYGQYAHDLILVRYTANTGIVPIQTLPSDHIFAASKFRQYVFIGSPGTGNTARYLTADGTISVLNLAWFRIAVPDQSIDDLVPGPLTQQPLNFPPEANAGPDQTVTASSGDTASVTLDGSGSSDSDGTITAYRWYENDILIAAGVVPQIELSVGLHAITLTAVDDDGATGQDDVVITVESARPSGGPHQILFSSADIFSGESEIYLVNPNGTGMTPLTNTPGLDSFPAWSSDGSRVAFASTRDGDWEIYVMDSDGSNGVQLTTNAACDRPTRRTVLPRRRPRGCTPGLFEAAQQQLMTGKLAP